MFQYIVLLIQWTLSMLNTGRYPSCRLGAFYIESYTFYDLRFSLWLKSYAVNIQMKPLQQNFHMVLFT